MYLKVKQKERARILVSKIATHFATKKADLAPAAEVSHLSFCYESEEILSDVSAVIPRNQIVGIVGKSGSGKSTLLKLLMRFWRPSSGRISVAGKFN